MPSISGWWGCEGELGQGGEHGACLESEGDLLPELAHPVTCARRL